MRILVVGINYAPEMTGIAPYTTGLAEGLSARGHAVTVYTGLPHYPEWRIAPGYEGDQERVEYINGVRVHRFPHFVPSDVTLANRLRMELSFGRRASSAYWGPHDLVIAVTPALAAAALVVTRARALRIPIGLIVHDLYGLGMRETGSGRGLASNVALAFESAVFRRASGITVIHRHFQHSLVDMGVNESATTVIRNWSHLSSSCARSPEQVVSIRTKYGWSPDETIVVHTGNMGVKQGLESVVAAARRSDSRGSNVRFVLVGDGNQRQSLQDSAVGVDHIQFLPPLPEDEFYDVLAAADVLLVHELPGLHGMAVPSKMTSYFTAGRPVLAAVAADGVSAEEVRASGAGIVIPAGDPDLLVTEAESLVADRDLCARLGANGPEYALRTLSEAAGIDSYDRWCRSLDQSGYGTAAQVMMATAAAAALDSTLPEPIAGGPSPTERSRGVLAPAAMQGVASK